MDKKSNLILILLFSLIAVNLAADTCQADKKYFDSTKCVDVTPVDKCQHYEANKDACKNCLPHYILKVDTNTCIYDTTNPISIPNCQTIDTNGVCTKCSANYYINSTNQCTLIKNCQKLASDANSCDQCVTSFDKKYNVKCIPAHCDQEDSNDLCDICHPGSAGNGNEGSVGYLKKLDGTCQQQTYVPSCQQYSASDDSCLICVSGAPGYYKNFLLNECDPQNVILCKDSGYKVNENSCLTCKDRAESTQDLKCKAQNCQQFNSNGANCDVCNPGQIGQDKNNSGVPGHFVLPDQTCDSQDQVNNCYKYKDNENSCDICTLTHFKVKGANKCDDQDVILCDQYKENVNECNVCIDKAETNDEEGEQKCIASNCDTFNDESEDGKDHHTCKKCNKGQAGFDKNSVGVKGFFQNEKDLCDDQDEVEHCHQYKDNENSCDICTLTHFKVKGANKCDDQDVILCDQYKENVNECDICSARAETNNEDGEQKCIASNCDTFHDKDIDRKDPHTCKICKKGQAGPTRDDDGIPGHYQMNDFTCKHQDEVDHCQVYKDNVNQCESCKHYYFKVRGDDDDQTTNRCEKQDVRYCTHDGYIDNKNECQNCKVRTFKWDQDDSEKNKCFASNCLTFHSDDDDDLENNDKHTCRRCNHGNLDENGKIVTPGFYVRNKKTDNPDDDDLTCENQDLVANCIEYADNENSCLDCATGYKLNPFLNFCDVDFCFGNPCGASGTCINLRGDDLKTDGYTCNCQPGYFFNNTTCEACSDAIPHCLQCANSHECTSCKNSFYLIYKNFNVDDDSNDDTEVGEAEADRVSGHYCKHCIQSCKVCKDNSTCDWCQENSFYHSPSKQCLSNCPVRYYNSKSTGNYGPTCNICEDNCDQCVNYQSCVKCSSGYLLLNADCFKDCGIGKYLDLTQPLAPICTACELDWTVSSKFLSTRTISWCRSNCITRNADLSYSINSICLTTSGSKQECHYKCTTKLSSIIGSYSNQCY